MRKWLSSMLPLNWLRKRHPNRGQAQVIRDGGGAGDLLQWIRGRLGHAPHRVRSAPLLAYFPFGFRRPGQEHHFHIPFRCTPWLAQTWEKDNQRSLVGKMAMAVFS